MKWTPELDSLISERHRTAKELSEIIGVTPHAIYQRRSKLGVTFWVNKKPEPVAKSKWPKGYKFYRKFVLSRDNYVCAYCGGFATQVDHVIPRNHGGSDFPNNLVASCAKCNNRKGSSCVDCPNWKRNG